MPPLRLTQTDVRKLVPDPSRQVLYRDTEAPGLALRVTPNGSKTYVFSYSLHGRERRMRIGDSASYNVMEAREIAKKLRRDVDGGIDPLEVKVEIATAPTVETLWEEFSHDHLPEVSAKYRGEQFSYWKRHILPPLGRKKVSALTHQDIVDLHRKVSTDAPILANRVLASLRKALSYAITREWVQRNVAEKVKQNREKSRRRYLLPAELASMASALQRMTNRPAAHAITLLLLTGARKSEVLGARWEEFERVRSSDGTIVDVWWNKPGERVKTGQDIRIHLPDAAVEALDAIAEAQTPQSEYLFPARVAEGPITDVNYSWRWLLKEVGLKDFHLHDLRHTYASLLISNDLTLAVVAEMLGHTQVQTTARYAHLMDDKQRTATTTVDEAWKLATALSNQPLK